MNLINKIMTVKKSLKTKIKQKFLIAKLVFFS